MRILLTNDDGIMASGIKILAEVLSAKFDVTVVAPDSNRSCCSHGLTIFQKLTYSECLDYGDVKAYALSGTPADCVKFGTMVLMDNKPDLLISGINDMPNLGTDVIYSGTVAAALEGSVCGYKSLAVSALNPRDEDYRYIAEFLSANIHELCKKVTANTILNINFPDDAKSNMGVRFAKLGVQYYSDRYIEQADADDDKNYYILTGERLKQSQIDGSISDVDLFDLRYITMTPMNIQMTDFDALEKLLVL